VATIAHSDEWGNALVVGDVRAGDAIEVAGYFGPVDLVWLMPPAGTERDEELAGAMVEVISVVGRCFIVGTVEASLGWARWLAAMSMVVRVDPVEGAVHSGDHVAPNGSSPTLLLDPTERMVVVAGDGPWVRSIPPDRTDDPVAHYLGAAGVATVFAPMGGALGVLRHTRDHGGAVVAMFEDWSAAQAVVRSHFGD
jgi:hypothetical protein